MPQPLPATPVPVPMDLMAEINRLIGSDLQAVETIFSSELTSAAPCVRDLLQHASRFRGKRLRPILVLLGGLACGEIRKEHHVLAAVVEMIHVASLVHDDILDEATVRRHVATINSRWNNEASVLFGDYIFSHAFHLAMELGSTEPGKIIARATHRICVGELTQVHERGNLDLTEDQYFQIIEGKTAELLALCGELAGWASQADDDATTALRQYALLMGLAFQIADDLLDLTGDQRETGKTLGSDLSKQKLTLPLIRLLATTEGAEHAAIRQLLSQPDASTRERLQPYFDHSDAINYSRTRAQQLAEEAVTQLDRLPDNAARRFLADIARFAAERKF